MVNLPQLGAEIDGLFPQKQPILLDFDARSVLDSCKEFFNQRCAEGGVLDPRPLDDNKPDEKAFPACLLYGYAALKFVEWKSNYAAAELLLHGWDKFNAIQKDNDRKIYKGILAFRLVYLYQEILKDNGAAIRWALLTHADDALVRNFEGGGMQSLRYNFGMSEQALSQFDSIIRNNGDDTRMHGWSASNRFADDMLLKFALDCPQHAHIFANPTAVLEFPPNYPYLTALWKTAKTPTVDNQTTATGNALEYLAAYLFLLIPGLIPRPKVKSETQDSEHDLVVSNLRSFSNFEAELFGRDFLVECKNWEKPVGVSHVGYFLYRMKLTHTRFGVIFAPQGISGDKKPDEEIAARSLCRRAFHEDDSICIVINGDDLGKILSKETTFRSLLMEKVNLLRFGHS